ncbi:MAG: 30S ribosomal protein S3 [Candidatus Bathyarchaeota archaeon]|nr:MAG: 30S ribosomal protein S3 [Candidatus Bathyarchaeota archaeon]
MSIVKHFIDEAIRTTEIDEYLARELSRSGYGGAEITRTPLGTRIIVYAMKPGIVIGRRGSNIRNVARVLEDKFNLSNPQIAVSEIEVPELNPRIMATRIAEALLRGTHFRRIGFWAMNAIMNAGAFGVEICIRGKLTTQRHRYEKYRAGYMPKTGDPALKNVKTSVINVKLKPGILGINVKIVPPDAVFPDKIEIKPTVETGESAEKDEEAIQKVE